MDDWVKSHVTLTVLIVLGLFFVVMPIVSVILMSWDGGSVPGSGTGEILDSP